MPLNPSTVYEHGESRISSKNRYAEGGAGASGAEHQTRNLGGGRQCHAQRRGIPFEDTSLLGPIRQSLPALPNLQSLRNFLPTSPPAETRPSADRPRDAWSRWQDVDLGGGLGRQNLLLVSSPECALRIFRHPDSTIPTEHHVQEDFPAPQEIFSVRKIRRDGSTWYSSLPGVEPPRSKKESGLGDENGNDGRETVMDGRIVEQGGLAEEYGPVLLLLTTRTRVNIATMSLVIIPVRTGLAVQEVQIGTGTLANLQHSSRMVAIGLAAPTPLIHLLHPSTLQHLSTVHISTPSPHEASRRLPPVFAISGRLIAYATAEPPRSTGFDGLGSVITARSNVPAHKPRIRASTDSSSIDRARYPAASPQSASSALISSAVGIGNGVAKGVWAGIKMGAQAANQARVSGMAKSAPARESVLLEDDDEAGPGESRSMEQTCPIEERLPNVGGGGESGRWIKIVDLGRLPPDDPPSSPYAEMPQKISGATASAEKVIAHFRLPSSPIQHFPSQFPSTAAVSSGLGHLSWNHDGTQLLVAPSGGRVFHIMEIHPAGPLDRNGEVQAEVLHLYELRRGTTAARVQEVQWDRSGRWIGVTSDKGTTHIYPIHPSGGPSGASTHLSARMANPKQLYPLSHVIQPCTRTHVPLQGAESAGAERSMTDQAVSVNFARWQAYPLEAGSYCQDISMFRQGNIEVIDTVRLIVKAVPMAPNRSGSSGLTEMLRSKSVPGDHGVGIVVQQFVKARWKLPEVTEDILVSDQVRAVRTSKTVLSPLAHAEIRTHSVDHRIMPPSIYLNHQVDFYSAKPIDEYTLLSILDLEARQHRLTYRTEVQARPATKQSASFGEPLSTALKSRIESPTRGEIPGLPNVLPGSAKWKTAIPIRTVAAGVGEGIGKVRHQYAKAQATRRRRRASEIQANGLSFEEDTIFASSLDHVEDSSPSSEAMPVSDTEVEDGWGEGWEEEYRKAVEVEGEPDDLILGLMDEEEEERRKYLSKAEEKVRSDKKGSKR